MNDKPSSQPESCVSVWEVPAPNDGLRDAVEQGDRDAATNAVLAAAADIDAGDVGGTKWLAELFAAHRLAAIATMRAHLLSDESEARAVALEEAAQIVEHRLALISTLTLEAATAVASALPDAIRELARKP
jgi:hypothetical protein